MTKTIVLDRMERFPVFPGGGIEVRTADQTQLWTVRLHDYLPSNLETWVEVRIVSVR